MHLGRKEGAVASQILPKYSRNTSNGSQVPNTIWQEKEKNELKVTKQHKMN